MAEYIEREKLREAFIKHFDAVYDNAKLVFSDNICTAEDCEDILKLVAELPTADVVPVVRCKDCKHYKTDSYYCQKTKQGYCELDDTVKQKQGYCSYGERSNKNDKRQW